MDTLVLFHHILNALKVPLVTMCAYDHVEAVSGRMNLGSCFNVLKPLGTETVNILMHKAMQHRSTRVLSEGSSIRKKSQDRMDLSSTKNHGSDTEEDEEPDVFKAHDCPKKLGRFTWTRQLHEKFLLAVEVLGESATPRNIRLHMNVKNLNLTSHHIASHLQKHRLREQRSKQEEKDYQQYASMTKLSDLITSGNKMQIRDGVASSIWNKYPGNLWAQVKESSAKAEVFNTNAHKSAVFEHGTKSAVFEHGTKSVWDKYEESLHCYDAMTLKRKLLPVKSRATDEYVDIEDIYTTAAGETAYGAPASVRLERSGSDNMITSLLQQLNEGTSRAEAAVNNVNLESSPQACYTMNQVHAAVNLQKDTMNQVHTTVAPHGNAMNRVHAAAMVADRVVDLGSNSLQDGTGSSRSTAEKVPSDPLCSWQEVDAAFWMSQLEGQEQQSLGADDLLQVDDAWNQALQPAIPANVGDAAPVAQMGDVPATSQESDFGDALSLAYDPENEFSIDDVPIWTPQFADDMPF